VGFSQLPGVPAPHQKVAMGGGGAQEEGQGGPGMYQGGPARELPPYERGPPLSYMERIAEKRQLEEVHN